MKAYRHLTWTLLGTALVLSGCTVRSSTARVHYGASATVSVSVPSQVIVTKPPPPLRPAVATVPPAPGPHAVWVDGYYEWNGDWVWVPGHWEQDRAGYSWVAPVARREGGRIVYHGGFWRRADAEPPRVYREPSTVVVSRPAPPRGTVRATPPPARGTVRATPPPARGTVRATPPPAQGTVRATPPAQGTVRATPPAQGTVRATPPPAQGTVRATPPAQGTVRATPPAQGTVRATPPPARGTVEAAPGRTPQVQQPPGGRVVVETPPPRGTTPSPTSPGRTVRPGVEVEVERGNTPQRRTGEIQDPGRAPVQGNGRRDLNPRVNRTR